MARQQVSRAAGRSMQTTTRRGPGEALRNPVNRAPKGAATRRPDPRAEAKWQRQAKARRAGNPRE